MQMYTNTILFIKDKFIKDMLFKCIKNWKI